MPIRFDRNKLRETRQTSWLMLDLFMVVLVSINLVFIVFDTLYGTVAMQQLLEGFSPAFNAFYDERVHQHFLYYDLIFVAIFLAEFCFQWVMSVRKRIYPRWYFYPFMRWYDLVGCIPIGSLRMLRLLRIVSLLVRLQKMGVIDMTETRIYRFFEFYFNAFIDEVSDRVMIRTLDDVRREVEDETPITRKVITEVIAPQRELLVEHLSRRIGLIAQNSYQQHQDTIREYVDSVIGDAVRANAGIRNLERVPMLGRAVVGQLQQSINDIVYEVFDRTVRDVSAAENNRLVDESVSVIIDAILDDHPELGDIGTKMTVEAIELIKERVRVQHWKDQLRRRHERAEAMP
ncbi:ion transporter [Wenzhouxiangella sp. AB-CW3]|uniref:ion transporter n=1 Tax=Wenzhouxiangella sp. AB-CW3 TaxID=2771012 RepID=UPI00168B4702|nr:ion transporter [Wenzhouxiangella sp. AB-CW3]QOC22879.1 ion transporter [Wenzhouxiangella sp. AB-CW3]